MSSSNIPTYQLRFLRSTSASFNSRESSACNNTSIYTGKKHLKINLRSQKMWLSKIKKQPRGVVLMGYENLPADILVSIFLTLPMKSLARAMWTCKSWYTIISDPEFVEKHRKDLVSDYSEYLYIFARDPNIYFIESKRNVSSIDGYNVKGELDHYAESVRITYGAIGQILGKNKKALAWSSGGLFAFIIPSEKCFCICNPIIGEKIMVPIGPHFGDEDCRLSCILWWGFGYSRASKVYKIIVFHDMKDGSDGSIYTLGSGSSWRALPEAVPLARRSEMCVESEGNFFFLRYLLLHDTMKLVSFDTELEKCKFWKGPNIATTNTRFCSSLLTYGDTVAYADRRRGSDICLWVLRDKVNELWVNELNISTETINTYPSFIHLEKWINGETLFGSDGLNSHIIYDAKNKQFNPISLPYSKNSDGSRRFPYGIYPHIASLVSPKRIMGIPVPTSSSCSDQVSELASSSGSP